MPLAVPRATSIRSRAGASPILVRRARLTVGHCAALAQSVERLTRNEKVVGSIPTGGSTQTPGQGPLLARVGGLSSLPVAASDAPWCPRPSAAAPTGSVDQVAVEVHRHGRRGVPQDPLHHLRVGARAEPERRAGVPQVVNAQRRPADGRGGLTPADRRFQFDSLSGPPPVRSNSQCRGSCPPPRVDDRHQLGDEQYGAGAAPFKVSTYSSPPLLLARTAALQAQALTRHGDAVADLEAGQLAPPQPARPRTRTTSAYGPLHARLAPRAPPMRGTGPRDGHALPWEA